jgi:transcription antitermination factor NusG
MPVLPFETDVFPSDLLEATCPDCAMGRLWFVLHTRPRQEKAVARQLLARQVPYFLPLYRKRTVYQGRSVTSHLPLFPGYVFLLAGAEERLLALKTNRVLRTLSVLEQEQLWYDLRQIRRLLLSGAPVSPQDRLGPGDVVEIQSGPLTGLRGTIERTASGRRFVVRVDFIQRGAAVLLDDSILVKVG